MTIVTRQRSDNFAIIPNAVAEDTRLSFEARGLLVYLLAKPNNWQVNVDNIRRAGAIGRDKVYRLLKELREAGYIEIDIRRGEGQRIVEHNYIVYDCAVPERLPLPENPEVAEPVPEKPEVGPTSSESHFLKSRNLEKPYPENTDGLIRTQSNKTHSSPLPPSRFGALWAGWRKDKLPDSQQTAETLFLALGEGDRQDAICHSELWQKIQVLRSKPVAMITYLRSKGWRDLIHAPSIDKDGDFVITPKREEWTAWLEEMRQRHGDLAAQSVIKAGRLVVKDRWPPGARPAEQLKMAIG